MPWVQKNTDVVIKAIGTVESGFDYGAINYNDPITVGVAQWFGGRAYNMLNAMRTADPTRWANVAASIRNDVENNTVNWSTRYLTRTEGESLRPLLRGNKDIQNQQFSNDVAGYVNKAREWNLDVDNAVEATMFFCTTYHQSPARTLDIVRTFGTNTAPTLIQYYNATMANPVLGQYASRQNKVLDIIRRMDSTGVDSPLPDVDDEPIPPEPGTSPRNVSLTYVEVMGDQLSVHFSNGKQVMAYPSTVGRWLAKNNTIGSVEGGDGGDAPGDTSPDPGDDPVFTGDFADVLDNMRCTNRWGTGGYSATGFHTGIDLGARRAGVAGDPIYAMADGTVVRTGGHQKVLYGHSGYGILLDIGVHDGVRYWVFYGHLNSIDVRQGQKVKAGQKIATMGGTGANHSNTDFAVHLHLNVLKGITVNTSGATIASRSHFIDPVPFMRSHGIAQNMSACP